MKYILLLAVFVVPSFAHALQLSNYDLVLLNDINVVRAIQHIPALKVDDRLIQVACAKALDLATTGNFSHFGSDDDYSWHWYTQFGYDYHRAAENLGEYFVDPDDEFGAYMQSPSHKANMLNPYYQDVGMCQWEQYDVVEFGEQQP